MPCGQANCRSDPLTSSSLFPLYTSAVAGLCPCYFLPTRHRSFFQQQICELGHYDEVMKEFVQHSHHPGEDELEKIRDTMPCSCPSYGMGMEAEEEQGRGIEKDNHCVIVDQPHSIPAPVPVPAADSDCGSPTGCNSEPEALVEPDAKKMRTLIKVEGFQTPDNRPPKSCWKQYYYTVFH